MFMLSIFSRKAPTLLFWATCLAGLAAQEPARSAKPAQSMQHQSLPGVQQAASHAEARQRELPPTNDPKEIVRRSIETDHRNWERARNYTFQQRAVEKRLGKHGEVKSTEIRTYEVTFYYGEEYSRLIQRDDKPLSDGERKKEDEKLEKFLSKLRNQSQEEREDKLAKARKQREQNRALLRDVANAYDFTLLGEENVDGADAWVIQATPRKDFHPTQPHAEMLSKIKGKVWIEKKEYNWVKAEAESIGTISFGLFLARVHPGSRLSFEQTHLNNEVWLIRRFYINGGVRLALLKNLSGEEEDTFSNYKKFVTSTRILPGKEVSPEQPPK
jgi:hypothetical protein